MTLQNLLARFFVPALMALPAAGQAAVVIDGSLLEYQDANGDFASRTVDFVPFHTAGGVLSFDILASGQPGGLDDPMLWIFNDDGHLDPEDWVAENDDTDFALDGNGDGSASELDPLLSLALPAGGYLLAIGSGGDVGGADVVDGLQWEAAGFGSGLPAASSLALGYQLIVSGGFNTDATPVPEPATGCLLASGLAAAGLRPARRRARRAAG